MAKDTHKTSDQPKENEVKIHLKSGGYTIIPKLNRDNFVRLQASNISYIEVGGDDETPLPEVNVEAPTVEAPTETKDPSMQWSRPKLLKRAKKLGIKYSKDQIAKSGLTKTEIISDILTHKPE